MENVRQLYQATVIYHAERGTVEWTLHQPKRDAKAMAAVELAIDNFMDKIESDKSVRVRLYVEVGDE